MAKWKATSVKDKAAVINAKLNNIDASTRDIEKETWVNYSTASRILNKNLKQVATHSEELAKLVDINTKIINAGKSRLLADIENAEVKNWTDRTAMNKIIDDAFKQSQLATWWKTANIWIDDILSSAYSNLVE